MAEPITTPLIQATFLLTCWFIIQHFLTSAQTFFSHLEHRAPSHRGFLCKLSRIKQVPKKKKRAGAARTLTNKIKSEPNDLPRKTHLLVLSERVDCRVDRALHVYLQDSHALSVFYTTACDVRERTAQKLTEFFMAYNFVVDKKGNHARTIHETGSLHSRSDENEGDVKSSSNESSITSKADATRQQGQHPLRKFIDNLAKHRHKTSMVIATHLRHLRRICKMLTCCYGGSHFANSSTEQAICDIADNVKKPFLHNALIHERIRFLARQCAQHQAQQLQHKLHAIQHSFSRSEHCSSITEGPYMKATQILRGTFFALQNSITLGNNILCWTQLPQLGLKSGPTTFSFHGNHLYLYQGNTL
eukprot:CCRYP_010232-RA/>CCRYP_010232-RA protein AED:0.44 eAED:1.00 QI:0/0/0/1/1/1/2/0/359